MKLSDIQDQFEDLGVGVVGMTYDSQEDIQSFHVQQNLGYPILKDVDAEHVDAWGIRNEAYEDGSFADGIPHPGVVLISPDGKIIAKYAEEGYRSRADWADVLEDVRQRVSRQ